MFKKILYALITVSIFMSVGVWAQEKNPVFNVITVDGVITSPTAKYINGNQCVKYFLKHCFTK